MYEYAYAAGGLYSLAIWVLVYRLTPGSRKVMLWGGLLATWMGPLLELWHTRDYWRPEYLFPIHWGSWTFGLEDLLISFAFGGITAGLFDLLLRCRGEKKLASIKVSGAIRVFLILLAAFGLTSLLIILFRCNSLYATVMASTSFGLWFLNRRRQWIPAALISGLLFGVSLLISYWGFYFQFFPEVLHRWWLKSALSGIMVLGVPVEELVWAATSGLFYGPTFRYYQDLG